jgi:DNA-binding IclR family transcriptional regulator
MAREHRAAHPPQQLDRHRLSVAVQIQSIERAAAVLRLLTGDSRPRALAELAAELQLPKGTVYGILRTLQTVGFVEQDTESRRYQLGAALLHIGSSYLNGSELRRRAVGAAHTLATRSGESVRIGTLHEAVVLIVHHVPGPDEPFQTPEVGNLMPLHATALGKALLAHHPHLATEIGRAPLAACTTATITDPARLTAQLARISERGWAGDLGEFLPGVASIAAPIDDGHGAVLGAVAVSGPTGRICQDGSPRAALVGYVMENARTISRQLGGRRW